MSIKIIPLDVISDQTFVIDLNGQDCQIHLYLRFRNMYMDFMKDDEILFQGKICLNDVDLITSKTWGFDGQVKFIDTQGSEDPYYTGFGERWFLVYVQ